MSRTGVDAVMILKKLYEHAFPRVMKFSPATKPSDTLYVSGLHPITTSYSLKEAFSRFGQVVTARAIVDEDTEGFYCNGLGFVKYSTVEEASKGIEGMHCTLLHGWFIFAEYATPRKLVRAVRGAPLNFAENHINRRNTHF